MGVEDRARELAVATGLKAVDRRVFGRYQGHLVNVRFGGATENYRVTYVVKVTPGAGEVVSRVVEDKELTKPLRRIQTFLTFRPGANAILFQLTPMGMTPKVEVLSKDLEVLAGIAARAGSNPGDQCESCGTNPGQPMVVNDEPMNLCPACLQQLQGQYVQAKAYASASKPNLARGLGMGFLGALIGAVVWGGIGAATGYVFGLVAIVIGLVVGWFMHQGAGQVNVPLIVAAVAFTLLAVFLGDLIWIAALLAREGVSPALVLVAYPILLSEDPGGFAIEYFFALFGIVVSVRYLWRAKREQTPQFEVVA